MNRSLVYFFCLLSGVVFAQNELLLDAPSKGNDSISSVSKNKKNKPPIDLYKFYTLEKDTTYVDTTLNIKKEYKYNLLRKDIFGLLPFANEGHTYNTLDFTTITKKTMPNFGFTAKHFNYLEEDDIMYYNVPTPLTELYFKTVMEQGQSVDAFLTANTSKRFNFSIAYKGLRSVGKYVNAVTSSGNLRFTTSYFTPNKRYYINAHFTGQDISNGENGGITDTSLFTTSNAPYNQRENLSVYFNNTTSFLKGNRFFIDHTFKINPDTPNTIVLHHRFNHEYKFFEFTQPTVSSVFGNAFSTSITNKTRYNHLYNLLGVGYTTKKYGNIEGFIKYNTYNYFYKSVLYNASGGIEIPNAINDNIATLGANYSFRPNNKIQLNATVSNTLSNQSVATIVASVNYQPNANSSFKVTYQKLNSLPNLNYTLFQSSYVNYNWFTNFKNEKRNQFQFEAKTKWLNVEANFITLQDYLYFYNTATTSEELIVKPFQYNKSITYTSVKANKEFTFWKLGLDNTVLYQTVSQNEKIVNVPEFTLRHSFYFSDYVFKRAMLIQTGFVFNYFTSYYANSYNPLLGEFFVQQTEKIGNFPRLDFFINAKVRQTRIFLKAEHFNSAWTGYNFYSAPNYPYRDFIVRFGLVWNFFK